MGADARWVCHTCKTVCNRGGRPVFSHVPGSLSVADVREFYKKRLKEFTDAFEFDDKDDCMSFLDDLQSWLSRHEGHSIHIGSDYSTDAMDLDDYHNESVDGKVSDCTRIEAQAKGIEEWRQTCINEIKKVIRMYVDDADTGIVNRLDSVAAELYDKFSMKEI